ncbi:hypothetical protein BBP29_17175 [Alteromonas macleodii]|jgi:hypothetical protein|nr:hypothetical protein BBP29_17175 [Alteromonas macleodii]
MHFKDNEKKMFPSQAVQDAWVKGYQAFDRNDEHPEEGSILAESWLDDWEDKAEDLEQSE